MTNNTILYSQDKSVYRYNTAKQSIDWKCDFEKKIYSISRVGKYVLVSTMSNWGKKFTTLIDFDKGIKEWTINEVFYSIRILEDSIIYVDLKRKLNAINLKTGEKKFQKKLPFMWSTKIAVIGEKLYLFSSKKAYVINQQNGELTESKTPNKINPKKLGLVIDEFEIEINEIPKHDGGQVIITG